MLDTETHKNQINELGLFTSNCGVKAKPVICNRWTLDNKSVQIVEKFILITIPCHGVKFCSFELTVQINLTEKKMNCLADLTPQVVSLYQFRT